VTPAEQVKKKQEEDDDDVVMFDDDDDSPELQIIEVKKREPIIG